MVKIWNWCKKEAVLSIAMVLAVISAFVIPPDRRAYIAYIDFRTLGILFCLMAVMAGLQGLGVFSYIAEKLLSKVRGVRSLVFILIMLCFFGSMVITNDVALITFVPFSFVTLQLMFREKAKALVVPVVVMQTVAANLGSMLTPIGNPQNLYLFSRTEMGFGAFVWFMTPYTLVAFLLLVIWCITFKFKDDGPTSFLLRSKTSLSGKGKELALYVALFICSLLTVVHVIPYEITTIITLIVILFMDRTVLKRVDYTLLLTFVGFFIFIGNMGRVPVFRGLLQQIIQGNEILTSVVASQFMSNVPAALLLSGFTDRFDLLIIGTNLGGLGTLIASMASLISFKYIGKEYKELKGRYFVYFTVVNLIFLAVLAGVSVFVST